MSRNTKLLKRIDATVKKIASDLALLANGGLVKKPPTQHETGRSPVLNKKKSRKMKLSPKALKQLQLQGTYMGLVRQLSAPQKAMLKKLRQEKGYPAAIAAARKMVKK